MCFFTRCKTLTQIFVLTDFQPEVKKREWDRTARTEGPWPAEAGAFAKEMVCQGFSGEGREWVEAWNKLIGNLFQAPRLAKERHIQKTVAAGLCYLTSLSSYLAILPLNTMNSNVSHQQHKRTVI